MRTLCAVNEIPENGARGFPGAEGSFSGIVAVRQGDAVHVYENACPHIGTPLDWVPDKFLSANGKHLICATHGAEFTIGTGECISGPCRGDYLTRIKAEVRDGIILVPEDA
jgi:nitrite reductase/ring-hydroxylating ferredoxin subunit